jgi:disulfide bond formation protein DsbB
MSVTAARCRAKAKATLAPAMPPPTTTTDVTVPVKPRVARAASRRSLGGDQVRRVVLVGEIHREVEQVEARLVGEQALHVDHDLASSSETPMSVATLSTFFALLSLACAVATVLVIILCVVARSSQPGSRSGELRDAIAGVSSWTAWLVAATATAGSLYYSLGAGYEPCELCWYQRICIYPLTVVLFVGAVRRDRQVWLTALPLCAVGSIIAAYHTQLQAFPDQTTFCSLTNPCTTRYVWEFGFVSLPFMALTAFCFIITLTVVARSDPDGATIDSEEPTS